MAEAKEPGGAEGCPARRSRRARSPQQVPRRPGVRSTGQAPNPSFPGWEAVRLAELLNPRPAQREPLSGLEEDRAQRSRGGPRATRPGGHRSTSSRARGRGLRGTGDDGTGAGGQEPWPAPGALFLRGSRAGDRASRALARARGCCLWRSIRDIPTPGHRAAGRGPHQDGRRDVVSGVVRAGVMCSDHGGQISSEPWLVTAEEVPCSA